MKRFLLGLALAFFAACDDESSFAPRDDESSSSIEDVTPQSSEDETSVSSSKAKSSSSVAPKSSESAKSSSSVIPASSGNLQSSSSKKESSSSEYVPFDHTVTLGEMRDEYKKFTDERNGRTYYYLTIRGKNSKGKPDSVTVMAENLNIGTMIFYDDDQANDSKIERYCCDDDTTKCDRYGGLYQWAEMMQLPSECNTKSCADLIQPNHQGICPDGWRLLTQEDFYIVINADGNTHGIAGVRSGYGFGGFNTTGYSLVGAGYVWDRRLKALNSSTYWYYPEEAEGTDAVDCAPATGVSNTATGTSTFIQYKHHGFSVRCVKVE